jgi:branched-chain amino acid transport system permease protein
MYWVDALNQVLIFAILAMSLNLLLGYAGQISVAHAAFAAIGGYTAGYLSAEQGTELWLGILIGVAGAFVIGMLISLPALLLASDYVILLTLSVQTIILVLITSIADLGGLYGITGLPIFSFFGEELLRPNDWLLPLILINLALFGLLSWIGESPFGRILRGIREDQLATQSLGKEVWLKKVVVFGLTSAIAALGGVLLAFYNGIVAPGLYGFEQSILIVAMVVIGGRGNLLGSVLGAALVIGAGPFFEKVVSMTPEDAALVRLILFGALLVVVVLLRPRGLLPEGATIGRLLRKVRRAVRTVNGAEVSSEKLATEIAGASGLKAIEDPEPVVSVRNLRKAFGGIVAVNGLSFELLEGRVTGLIGPNGAGKTTVFNLLTGALPPDEGSVYLRSEDITGWPIDRVARNGMVRSFQDVRIFPGLSVLDNVLMAVPDQRGETLADLLLRPWSVFRDRRRVERLARQQLAFVGLAPKADFKAGDLPFGEQKLLALARILATDPEVLLLDEPASGIDAEWVERMIEIIRLLRDHGLTICVVEHNLHVVERAADHIYFMDGGRISAGGTMDELIAEEELVEAYFGQP